jgi:hypothetical protein
MKVLEGEWRIEENYEDLERGRGIEEIEVRLGGREKEKGRFGETAREKKVGEKQD